METQSWTRRIALGGCAVATGVALCGAGTAAADPPPSSPSTPPGSVTITLTAEQVAFLCDKRLPRVENRVGKLIERINGGPEVRGSTEWLKRRAQQEREAGRETSAGLLEERAERRAGKIDQLNKIKGWASDFRTQHCGAK